jgi:hypothetical protein
MAAERNVEFEFSLRMIPIGFEPLSNNGFGMVWRNAVELIPSNRSAFTFISPPPFPVKLLPAFPNVFTPDQMFVLEICPNAVALSPPSREALTFVIPAPPPTNCDARIAPLTFTWPDWLVPGVVG